MLWNTAQGQLTLQIIYQDPREHTSNNAQETDEFARTVVGLQRVMVVDNPAAVTIQEIREETRKDATLRKLQQTIRTG